MSKNILLLLIICIINGEIVNGEIDWWDVLSTDLSCCSEHTNAYDCGNEGGSDCSYVDLNKGCKAGKKGKECRFKKKLAAEFGSCLQDSFIACKVKAGKINACCAPGCKGIDPPAGPPPPGQKPGEVVAPNCFAKVTPSPSTPWPTRWPTRQPTRKVTPSPVTPSPTTPAPVTPSPVTPAPVTPSPTTPSPTTPSPTTPSPTTPSPTTPSPTTPSPTTPSPTTPAPVTPAPVTPSPTTPAPVQATTRQTTEGPRTPAPVTPAPVTPAPITPAPVTPAPVTPAPVTPSPVTPAPVTPAPVTPSPTTPAPVTPSPTTPAPVTPAPVTPSPTTPAPVTPSPTTPAPVTPSPVTPAPVTPAPVTPAPVTPAPVTPAPVTPAPVTPAPVTPAPVTPAPVTPAPVTPAPVTPAPVTPAPVTPAPVTPAPVTPAPVTPAPVTPAPVAETTSGTTSGPRPTKQPVELGEDCRLAVNYAFEGIPCSISGDPHFLMWNGNNHDYQGQPDITFNGNLLNQYYYITQCDGSSSAQMPFRVLGTHYKMYPSVSGLDYIVVQLFDDTDGNPDGQVYNLYIHPEFIYLADATASGLPTDLDDALSASNSNQLLEITSATSPITIGNRFSLSFTVSGNSIDSTISIDDVDDAIFIAIRCQNSDQVRCRMSYAAITIDATYKCRACGLCGNFKLPMTGQEVESLEACDGELINYRAGYSYDTTPEAYDLHGWTFEKNYWDNTCSAYDTVDSSGNFVYDEPCDSDLESAVIAACTNRVYQNLACCNELQTECLQIQKDCYFDACVLATDQGAQATAGSTSGTTDADQDIIDDAAYIAFDEAVDKLCSLASQYTDEATDPLAGCNTGWSQCAGYDNTLMMPWEDTGNPTCCKAGYECQGNDGSSVCACDPDDDGQCTSDWYCQCKPVSDNCAAVWGQCGGESWTGPTCCSLGYVCIYQSDYYSQCLEPPDMNNMAPKSKYMMKKENVVPNIYQNNNETNMEIIIDNIKMYYIQISIMIIIIFICAFIIYKKKKQSDKEFKYIPIDDQEKVSFIKDYQSTQSRV